MKNNIFINWLTNSFAPKMNRALANPWLNAISSSFLTILPFILTGSLIYCYNVFRSFIPSLPDLGIILQYSFQLMALYIGFIVAYIFMEKKGYEQNKPLAGLLSISIMIMGTQPTLVDGAISFEFSWLGPAGVIYAMIVALFVCFIYNSWLKLNILKDSESVPDFIIGWLNNIIPFFSSLLITFIIVYIFKFDLPNFILSCFQPFFSFGQTYIGWVLIVFLPTFLYSLGISSWTTSGLRNPILLAGTAANIALIEQGLQPTNIVTYETFFTLALVTLGGMGATLPLNLLMLRSKSKKLKAIGKISIGPSIFNINEPLIFGTPIAFNPYLMIPMWINGIVGPTIIWIVMKYGLLNIPNAAIQVGQIPAPFASIMVTGDWRAIIIWLLLILVYAVIWYPGFKAYEAQCILEETTDKK